MKRLALSIQQPWAWLIVNGYKPVENRDWPTRVRGRVDIHAGKKFDREGYFWVRQNFPEIPLPDSGDLPTGGVVGNAEIVDCVRDMDSEWFFGEYGFVMRSPRPHALIPCRGQLGFFPSPVETTPQFGEQRLPDGGETR